MLQLCFFSIPLLDIEQSEAALNKFLRSVRVLKIEKQFCSENGGFWTVAVEYVDGGPNTEPVRSRRNEKETVLDTLNDNERQRFEHFKNIRRDISKERHIPAYMVFSDRELAILAKIPVLNEESVKAAKDITPLKLKEYVNQFYDVRDGEASGQLDAEDSVDGQSA